MVRPLLRGLHQPADLLPLALFRVAFGLLVGLLALRFLLYGWVEELCAAPAYHFTYFGFSWVRPLPGWWMHAAFALLGLLGLCLAAGLFYRLSAAALFLLFTYLELIDKTYYLNHYYLIWLLSLLLLFLPAHGRLSLDAWQHPHLRARCAPAWCLLGIRLQVGLVYFFAGLAKVQPDWLLHALPLKLWLAARTGLDWGWAAYAASWGGLLYDLSIPFLLSWRKTRLPAFAAVVAFHLATRALFPIGLFPWIMIAGSATFFSAGELESMAGRFGKVCRARRWHGAPRPSRTACTRTEQFTGRVASAAQGRATLHRPLLFLAAFFLVQFLLPLRHWLYPGPVCWTEEGFRFAWHVMLVEKTGHAVFRVTDPQTQRQWQVHPRMYLTRPQEQQLAFQPDMLLQFAHFLEGEFQQQGVADPQVRVEAYVSLNGRPPALLADPGIDLTQKEDGLEPYDWLLPMPP